MSNSIKNGFDRESLLADITERDRIIYNYTHIGILDRDDAIRKIQTLRLKDKKVAKETAAQLAISSIPFTEATNAQIISELIMQRDILQAKLIELQTT